jgi:hypothetical protein
MAIPTPEQVALARRLYVEGAPVSAIAAAIGASSVGIVYRCLDGAFADGTGVDPAPIPRRRPGVRLLGRSGSRAALVARLWRAAEQQVDEIERRLQAAGLELTEREGNARTLAVVVKTLRELAAFDEANAAKTRETTHDDDDAVPIDLDELRRELARRIEAITGSRADGSGGGPGAS